MTCNSSHQARLANHVFSRVLTFLLYINVTVNVHLVCVKVVKKTEVLLLIMLIEYSCVNLACICKQIISLLWYNYVSIRKDSKLFSSSISELFVKPFKLIRL